MRKVGDNWVCVQLTAHLKTTEIKAKAIKKHKIYLTSQPWKLALIAKGRRYIIRTIELIKL